MNNSLIQNVEKIENKLKKHNFIIDYQNNSKLKYDIYKKIFQNYDDIYAFWNMYNFEDFKNKYWNTINITYNFLENNNFFSTLFSDYDFKNAKIEQDYYQWFSFSPDQTLMWENIYDQSSLLTCFSKRKLQNKQIKDMIYSLETWLTYTKTIEKLLQFYTIRWINNFKRTSIFNFQLIKHYKIYQIIHEIKKITYFFSESNSLNNYKKDNELIKLLLKKDNLWNIFKESFVNYIFLNWIWERTESLQDIINKLSIWKLYDQNTKKMITSQKELDMKFKISWFLELFESLISKYFLLLMYNEKKEILEQDTEIYTNKLFVFSKLKELYKLFKNTSLYIVNELLQIKENDELLNEIFTQEFIDKEIKNNNQNFDQNINNLSFQNHFNTFIEYFWLLQKKEKTFDYYEDFFKFICFETKLYFFNSMYLENWSKFDSNNQKFKFFWKIYQEKTKWKENISEYLDVEFTISSDSLSHLYQYIDWRSEVLSFINMILYKQEDQKFYQFWFFWTFKILYELIWELKYQYSKKQKNSSHAIQYCDIWSSSALLENIIFENNKVFMWEQEKLYNSINSDLFWSWLISNFSSVCTNIYQKYYDQYEEWLKWKIYRWNWSFWYKNKKSIDEQIEAIWFEYWRKYLSDFNNNKKYSIIITWLQWKQSLIKNEKILNTFFTFENEQDWLQEYVKLQFYKQLQKNIDKIIEKLWKLKEWFDKKNEHKKILFFFDQAKFSHISTFDSLDWWFWKLYNTTCDFIFTKNCLIWIWSEWIKSLKDNKRIYWSSHYHWINFVKFEKNKVCKEKIYLQTPTREKCQITNLKEIDLIWFREKIYKDCLKRWNIKDVYLSWYTWKKYLWFKLIEFLYSNWFITNIKNRKFTELLKIVDQQIINTNKKNNEFEDFEKEFKKKYRNVYFNETESISILETFNQEKDKQKKYFSLRTFQFLLDELFTKNNELNEENIKKTYFKYRTFLDNQLYWLLQHFAWIEYIKNALKECILRDQKWKKKIYYLLLNDSIQTKNSYFWYDPYWGDILKKNLKNQSEYIKKEILFWKLRKFWFENWITFINILSKNEIIVEDDQIIVYYWDEESFLSKVNIEEINWLIFYNLDIELSKEFEYNMKTRKLKTESLYWYQYKNYYILHNILKWWVFTNWKTKNNFHFYRLFTKWNISYSEFFKNYNIHNNQISFEKTNWFEKFEKELLQIEKYNLNKLNNKKDIFDLIKIMIDWFLEKISILDEYSLDWDSYWNKTLFNVYENINFYEEFSIIIMKIKEVLDSLK